MSDDGSTPHLHESNVVETIQSLVVAFVLAMTFRGFVTEGFVIPTGSMAPTLLGQHALIHSQQTGMTFTVGVDQASVPGRLNTDRIADPMLGESHPGSGVPKIQRPSGMGDRILVLKALYPFWEPDRYDVVVFKNPTDPIGDAANYIKRLIGLPNEQVWITDGDVFARPWRAAVDIGGGLTQGAAPENQSLSMDVAEYFRFKIQRKPEHVQRAVWQSVFNSDFTPVAPRRIGGRRYLGPPWVGDASVWNLDGRTYRSNSAEPTSLVWENDRRVINDWACYNTLTEPPIATIETSDVRISASVAAAQPGFSTTLELEARSHLYQFTIQHNSATGRSTATLRLRALISPLSEADWIEQTIDIRLPAPGTVFNVEFWHVDQSMQLFIDGKRVLEPLNYDWSPLQRLQFTSGDLTTDDVEMLINRPPLPTQVRWRFEGSPVTLHQVRLDRDLHYRRGMLNPRSEQRNQPHIYGHAFGTHPESNAAVLGPDQFMMCGDNSQRSLDSRYWGRPHPLVTAQVGDDHPFRVNRRLLIGKAWVVYFPAPFPITEKGPSVVPDFGRLRFIR